ncbi:MAG: stage 0 sporulation protein [Oscillospiraceae bacterium]|jgi:cell fate regulator YaaT (PSP1 superfamily)|nr:stage 0 sporulation protein [Oscillospiraceae bacterium]
MNIIGTVFRDIGKISRFTYGLSNLSVGDSIIVRTRHGLKFGRIVQVEVSDEIIPVEGLILRKANKDDFEKNIRLKEMESEALNIVKAKVFEHNLKMKMIDAECMFDESKIIFYFSSEERVDFRILLSELVKVFKKWIELRQVNIRESAKILGGIGVCGRSFCCSLFLREFQKVDVQLAVDQGILVNSSKLCGACGRLFCCLRYELENYQSTAKTMPRVGDLVRNSDGKLFLVCGLNILAHKIKLTPLETPEATPKYLPAEQFEIVDRSLDS